MNMLAILNRREIFSPSIPFTVVREGIVQGKPQWHTWKNLETGDFMSITPDRADSYDASATVSRERILSWVEAIGNNFDSHCLTTWSLSWCSSTAGFYGGHVLHKVASECLVED